MMNEIRMFFMGLYEAYVEACEYSDLINKTV